MSLEKKRRNSSNEFETSTSSDILKCVLAKIYYVAKRKIQKYKKSNTKTNPSIGRCLYVCDRCNLALKM